MSGDKLGERVEVGRDGEKERGGRQEIENEDSYISVCSLGRLGMSGGCGGGGGMFGFY